MQAAETEISHGRNRLVPLSRPGGSAMGEGERGEGLYPIRSRTLCRALAIIFSRTCSRSPLPESDFCC